MKFSLSAILSLLVLQAVATAVPAPEAEADIVARAPEAAAEPGYDHCYPKTVTIWKTKWHTKYYTKTKYVTRWRTKTIKKCYGHGNDHGNDY